MKIALIISDHTSERNSLKVGLELEERLNALGVDNTLFDLQDDYNIHIGSYDSVILVTENQGPLISFELYSMILTNRSEWAGKLLLPISIKQIQILKISPKSRRKMHI